MKELNWQPGPAMNTGSPSVKQLGWESAPPRPRPCIWTRKKDGSSSPGRWRDHASDGGVQVLQGLFHKWGEERKIIKQINQCGVYRDWLDWLQWRRCWNLAGRRWRRQSSWFTGQSSHELLVMTKRMRLQIQGVSSICRVAGRILGGSKELGEVWSRAEDQLRWLRNCFGCLLPTSLERCFNYVFRWDWEQLWVPLNTLEGWIGPGSHELISEVEGEQEREGWGGRGGGEEEEGGEQGGGGEEGEESICVVLR